MPEPLTTQLVAELMQTLLTAFPSRNLAGNNIVHTAEIYRDGLRGLSGDAVRASVSRSIQEDTYFPKVARLRELASSWERHNRPTFEQKANTDPLWCGHCQSHSTYVTRWRPMVGKLCEPMLSDDGRYVLLEKYERLLCKCAAPCPFSPELSIEQPMMRAEQAGIKVPAKQGASDAA